MRKETHLLCQDGMTGVPSIETYMAQGGYRALMEALRGPDHVIAELKKSGLRGRSGSGFPTGSKWELVKATVAPCKYVVCNADEGEPGVCKDRFLLLRNPYALLEGMLLCGIAVGAETGYIYLRGEYEDVREVLEKAIVESYRNGYLGHSVMGSAVSFDVELRLGHGSYVCGEETALLESLEGKRGEPRYKPPYPGVAGLWDMPTVINNVETFINVPTVLNIGAEQYRKYGTPESPGTKLYTVSGNVCRPGVYELPLDVSVRELFQLAGGCPNGKELQGAQIGGGSGPFVGPDILDACFNFEDAATAGGMLGAGAIMFFDEDADVLALCENAMTFFSEHCCGKCTPCRVGCRVMLKQLRRIQSGQGDMSDLKKIKELGVHMQQSTVCNFGAAASTPILTALENFEQVFELAVQRGDRSVKGEE